jgi:hypothetical protein
MKVLGAILWPHTTESHLKKATAAVLNGFYEIYINEDV